MVKLDDLHDKQREMKTEHAASGEKWKGEIAWSRINYLGTGIRITIFGSSISKGICVGSVCIRLEGDLLRV